MTTWSSTSGTMGLVGGNTITISGFSTMETVSTSQNDEFETSRKLGIGLSQKPDGTMSPKLYFKYVKHKFSPLQEKKIKERIYNLRTLIAQAELTDQKALYEEYQKLIVAAIREQEAFVCGIQHFIKKETIERFIKKVEDKVVKLKPSAEFPRPIPQDVLDKWTKVKERAIFDKFFILYTDYVDEKLKTNKQRIIEKDPILFGVFDVAPDNYYPIADWEDEYCDITVEKLVETIKFEKLGMLHTTEDITEEYCDKMKKEVYERMNRLKNTNSSNFRNLAEQEDAKKKKKFDWGRLAFWR